MGGIFILALALVVPPAGGAGAAAQEEPATVQLSLSGASVRPTVPLPADQTARDNALRCLAMAISYEAGNEPVAGQEAVAQVILNRTRSPAFPKTVCGVVYQGAERRTGCQFTFTCDGSLRRPRSARSMAQAVRVAERALDGTAFSSIGEATHYHAAYVSPYWAPGLVRVTRIGAHIFYRAPGEVLAPGAFALPPVQIAKGAHGGGAEMATAPPGLVIRSATGVVFSPWGLPTHTVSRAGRVGEAGAPAS
jgi:hypothetical protein